MVCNKSIKTYGVADDDPTLEQAVRQRLNELNITSALILHYPRIPVNARPCQQPSMLRIEVVIAGRAYEAKQVGTKVTLGF